MTEAISTTSKTKEPKTPQLFLDELIDQLPAQVRNKDAQSISDTSGLAGQRKKRLAEPMLAEELGHDIEILCNARLAGSGLHGQLDRLPLELIRKMPPFRLLPPIVESYLSKVSVLPGDAQS